MTHPPEQPREREPDRFDPGPAVTRFVDRVTRRVGPSPAFAGAPTAPPPSAREVDHASSQEVDSFGRAGRRAIERYPGPVGEFVAHELETAANFGFRYGADTRLVRLVDHLLGADRAVSGCGTRR